MMADEPKPCPFCGTNEHLSVQAVGSMTSGMPARPFRVICTHIDHDTISGPVDYGRAGAITAWNTRPSTSPAYADLTPGLDKPYPANTDPTAPENNRRHRTMFTAKGLYLGDGNGTWAKVEPLKEHRPVATGGTPPAVSDDLVEEMARAVCQGVGDDLNQWACYEEEARAILPIIHRREQQAAEARWQPIETAPRDGTPFIAALTVRNIKTGQSWQETHVIWSDDETDEIANECERGWSRVSDYEWWMPVPPIRSLTTEVGAPTPTP